MLASVNFDLDSQDQDTDRAEILFDILKLMNSRLFAGLVGSKTGSHDYKYFWGFLRDKNQAS